MFIGHFGVGFGSKKAAPKTSLGTLFLAAQFIDLLWPTFLLFGLEQVRITSGATTVQPLDFIYYPFSHSLLAVLFWAVLVSGVYQLASRYSRGAIVLGLAVVSHWVLDAIVHHPDLPVYPGDSHLVGFGLWSSLPATLIIELSIFAVGLWLYLQATEATDSIGKWALWGLVIFLVMIYFSNLFGSPPPSVTAIGWVGQAQWLLVAWGYWVDRHRRSIGEVMPFPKREGRQDKSAVNDKGDSFTNRPHNIEFYFASSDANLSALSTFSFESASE